MTVHKVKGGYKVKSDTKGWLSKKPLTKEEALAQHRAIMRSKALKAKKKKKKK